MHKFCLYFQVCLRHKLLKEPGSKPVQTLLISLGINLNPDILFLGRSWKKSFACIYYNIILPQTSKKVYGLKKHFMTR